MDKISKKRNSLGSYDKRSTQQPSFNADQSNFTCSAKTTVRNQRPRVAYFRPECAE
ncbi:MAG: hypothetical protein HRT36_00005 [Alphaproteobacteria bacterium]|nr:hypothetical protein [Alphaproteobacteria bacterium]